MGKTEQTRIPPNSQRLVEALRSIGYSFEGAVADLVDNSIAAGARRVVIRLLRTDEEIVGLRIADDGRGMTRPRLEEAMRFGADMEQAPESLSKFGMGMKIASLSQTRSLTVASRASGQDSAMRWTVEGMANDWHCERLATHAATEALAEFPIVASKRSGTVVTWDHLDRVEGSRAGVERTVQRMVERLRFHLGLHLHRFIEDGRLAIAIEVVTQGGDGGSDEGVERTVIALNPFGYEQTERTFEPRSFEVSLHGIGTLVIEGHIWPPNASSRSYKLDNAAQRQGLYIYRNDRLIQAGGWNGQRHDSEPHLSLARLRLDLPPRHDSAFSLDVRKQTVNVPPTFGAALEASCDGGGFRFKDYLREAQKAYRKKERLDPTNRPLLPGTGIASGARQKVQDALAPEARQVREVTFEWAETENGRLVDLDLEGKRIVLNRQLRSRLLDGRPATATDAPVEKLLLFLLFEKDLDRTNNTRQHQERLEAVNRALLAVLKPPKE